MSALRIMLREAFTWSFLLSGAGKTGCDLLVYGEALLWMLTTAYLGLALSHTERNANVLFTMG